MAQPRPKLALVGGRDVAHIMDTFDALKRREMAEHGEFRTKREVLETYTAMADAIDERRPYVSTLTPGPGDVRVVHAPRTPDVEDMLVPADPSELDPDLRRTREWLNRGTKPAPTRATREVWCLYDLECYAGRRAPASMYPRGAPRFRVARYHVGEGGYLRLIEHAAVRSLDRARALVDVRCERTPCEGVSVVPVETWERPL